MSNDDYLVRHLDRVAGKKLARTARKRRNKALRSISRYCITVTRNGDDMREISTDRPPNLSELIKMAGNDAFIVSVSMRHQSMSPRPVFVCAAE